MKVPSEEEFTVESLEVTARTVNEAIEKALARLGKSRDEVDISVLSEGSRGILGIGGEDARILASLREPRQTATPQPSGSTPTPDQFGETARGVLENLLGGMRINGEVEIVPLPDVAAEDGFVAALDIVRPDDVGILIGRRGETLGSLQFLTTLIVAR